MDLENLLSANESKTLEFKSDLSSLDPILKTIVAFANTAGGVLILGLSSKKDVVGIEDIFKAEERLANAIADSIYPPMLPEIEIATFKKKNLLIVRVAHWKGPFYIKKLGPTLGVYVRLGSTSRPAGDELIAQMQREVLHLSFDEQPLSDLDIDSLDVKFAKKVFREVGKDLNEKKMCSLGLLVNVANRLVPSVGGIILFGHEDIRRRLFPDALVSCARFRGDEKSEIIDRYDVEGSMLETLDSVPKFILRNTRLSAEIAGIKRKDIREYPPIAIREALINALIHRDYSLIGSRIQIAIFNNRLEIQNPGLLPFGFTLEDLKAGISRIRNRVIARVFYELGLMEAWGSGYKRIIEVCNREGYKEPMWEELGSSIRVTFYPHQTSLLELPKQKELTIKDLSQRHREILKIFKIGEGLPFRHIQEYLKIPLSERSLRYDLAQLKDLGFLKTHGKGRALVWLRVK